MVGIDVRDSDSICRSIFALSAALAITILLKTPAFAQNSDVGCPDVRISHPVWSPSGAQIAFLSNLSGDYELYLFHMQTQSIDRVTNNPGFEGSVSWSPDSSKFAFWGDFPSDADFEGYVFDVADSSIERIISHPENDFDLDWSPDGERIVFQSERHGNRELYVLDIATSGVIRLTSNEWDDLTPDWSPSGQRLAFSSSGNGERKVHIMDLSSGTVTLLEDQPDGANYFPVWRPDGHQMLITSASDDSYSLFIVDLESGEFDLLASSVSSGPASWSPDGRAIVYSRANGTESHIRRLDIASRENQALITCTALRSSTS